MYELDEQEKREATEYIVGTWDVDYIINAFSADLAHIPAAEFKSNDGLDFSAIKFSFLQDGTVTVFDGNNSYNGNWEATGLCEYRYHLEGLDNLPDCPFTDNAEKLNVVNGALCFAIGFLSVCMKKIAEGEYSEAAVVDDVAAGADDGGKEIVGKYAIYKTMSYIDDNFAFYTKEAVQDNLNKQIEAGEMDEEEAQETLSMFDSIIEFTDDHRVISWFKLTDDITEDDVKEALEAGDISDYRDGYAVIDRVKEWKCVGGKYYYNTEESREVLGENVSSWDELKTDDEGCLIFGDGLMTLKRI